MQREVSKLLYDAQQACRAVAEFTHGKSVDDYRDNLMLRSAVERQLMIMGEALYQASKRDESLSASISDVRRIINFRHVIVHGYASLEHDTVWGIIEHDVPRLAHEIEEILEGC